MANVVKVKVDFWPKKYLKVKVQFYKRNLKSCCCKKKTFLLICVTCNKLLPAPECSAVETTIFASEMLWSKSVKYK